MHDWYQYVRDNLSLPGLESEREKAILEDLSQQLEQAYQEALSRGASEKEATAQTRRHIPDWQDFRKDLYRSERQGKKSPLVILEERVQDRRNGTKNLPGRLANDLLQDAVYALRIVGNNPGFAVAVILTLALGIGANTAIFSVVNAVLVRPLPYPDPDRLVQVWGAYPEGDNQQGHTSPLDLEDWREQNRVFDDIAGFPRLRLDGFVLTGGDIPREIDAVYVTEGFFAALGVTAHRGRTLLDEDHAEGNNQVVVLSHGAWQREFGENPSIVGSIIRMDDDAYTVVGIMPPRFEYPDAGVDLWAPLSLIPDSSVPRRRDIRWLNVVGRLKPGMTIERARAEMTTIVQGLAQQHPKSNKGLTAVRLQSLQEHLVGDVKTSILVIFIAVGLVLFIGCANVASLILVRAEGRGKEIALRAALGAGRGRLIRQVLTESLLLALIGGMAGVVIGIWSVPFLIAMAPAGIPRISGVGMDGNVLAFTAGLSVLTGLLFGLAPALKVATSDINEALKEGVRGTSSIGGRSGIRGILVVIEVAVVVVLAISAGLLVRSYARLLSIDPGFNPDNVLTMSVTAKLYKYPDQENYVGFFRDVLEKVRQVPGIRSAGMVRPFPLRGDTFEGENITFKLEGRPPPSSGGEPQAAMRFVSPDYFNTMGIPLLGGRAFNDRDNRESPFVFIVNQAAADRYWPGEDPVGQTVSAGSSSGISIIGVVGNVRQLTLAGEPNPAVYTAFTQVSRIGMTLVLRTAAEPLTMVGPVQNAIREINPDQPILDIASMEQVVSNSVAQRRFSMTLLGVFALLSIVLAAVGLYSVIAFMVSQGTHEIGIRTALGAQPVNILRQIVGHGMMLTTIGLSIGLAGAFALTRFFQSLLYGVTATDQPTYLVSSAALLILAMVACYIPARRAAKVDPMMALRSE